MARATETMRSSPGRPVAPRAEAHPDVRLEGVTKRLDDVVAVDDVSLAIESVSFFALLGPAGCVKASTLRMIGCLVVPMAR